MGWLHRKEMQSDRPVVNEETVRAAEEELRRSEQQLAETVERSGEVARVADKIENIGRRNHIGPSFFDALGIQRQQRRKA